MAKVNHLTIIRRCAHYLTVIVAIKSQNLYGRKKYILHGLSPIL